MRVDKRLEKLEAQVNILTKYSPIIAAMEMQLYYDELLEEEHKERYCEYIGIDQEIFENIVITLLGSLHIKLRKIEPPTEKELQAIITEVEQEVFK